MPPREFAAALAETADRVRPASSRWRSPDPASSTSGSTPPPPGSSPARSSPPAGSTAAATALAGQKINLEFVSANPTGPVHIGGVRWAAVGDALARLLRATGAEVGTEYYFNDAGSQIDRFAGSLLAAAKGEPAPEDGYGGAYIAEIAQAVIARRPERARPRRRRRPGGVPGRGRRADVRRRSGPRCATSACTSTLYFNEKDLHDRGELDLAAGPAARAGPHLRVRRRDLAAHHRLRRRQGPGAAQVQRRVDLLRRRLRLLPGQAGARLRPGRDHARRRPPRLHRPDEGDGRLLRRRPRPQPGDPHRPDGQPGPRRRSRCG